MIIKNFFLFTILPLFRPLAIVKVSLTSIPPHVEGISRANDSFCYFEIDSIAPTRGGTSSGDGSSTGSGSIERMVSQLLTEMD